MKRGEAQVQVKREMQVKRGVAQEQVKRAVAQEQVKRGVAEEQVKIGVAQDFIAIRIKMIELIYYLHPVLLLILELFLARLAMLLYRLDSNVTKLLANLSIKPSVFYYFANCIL